MPSFVCPFCLTNRDFVSLGKMFQHITLYHQSEPNFKITCDLHAKCGVLYRTYSAYKSHIYRQHSSELHSTEKHNNYFNIGPVNSQQPENVCSDVSSETIDSDDNDTLDFADDDNVESMFSKDDSEAIFYNYTSSFNSIGNGERASKSLLDIKRSCISFILQLREEFLLPKNTTNVISTYIVTLLHHVQGLLEEKTFHFSSDNYSSASSSQKQSKKAIEFDDLKLTLDEISNTIESITKNEYQFMKHCEEYFNYSSADEIILSSTGEVLQRAYFIPIEKSLFTMLNSKPLVLQILQNIQKQRTETEYDADLMFSIRDGYYGSRLDHDNLLLQLYLDDIGLTNPLGSKRDQHKMSMIYFSLEDIPDRYRSKIDFIQLLGICQSKILKVKTLTININSN